MCVVWNFKLQKIIVISPRGGREQVGLGQLRGSKLESKATALKGCQLLKILCTHFLFILVIKDGWLLGHGGGAKMCTLTIFHGTYGTHCHYTPSIPSKVPRGDPSEGVLQAIFQTNLILTSGSPLSVPHEAGHNQKF